MNVEFHPGATRDFMEALKHYADIRPELGARFVQEVNAAIAKIERNAAGWRVVRGSVRRVLTGVFPYALLYAIEGEVANVLAVAHTSREPDYWLDRYSNR